MLSIVNYVYLYFGILQFVFLHTILIYMNYNIYLIILCNGELTKST